MVGGANTAALYCVREVTTTTRLDNLKGDALVEWTARSTRWTTHSVFAMLLKLQHPNQFVYSARCTTACEYHHIVL